MSDDAPPTSAPADEHPAEPGAPVTPPGADVRRDRLRRRVGRGLFAGGALTLPLGLGAAGGYWLADRGVLWAPDMLGGLLGVWIVALLAMIAGSYLLGPAVGSPRGRRRIAAFAALIVLAAAAQVGVRLLGRPSPLTSMDEAAFRRAFALDSRQYRELAAGLAEVRRQIEALPAFHRAGEGPAPVLSADEERALLEAWLSSLHAALALDRIRAFYEDYLYFDLSRSERDRHVRSYLLTFAAELTLFEHAVALSELLERNANAVKFLDLPRPEHGLGPDSVAFVREELGGLSDLSRVVAGGGYLQWLATTHAADDQARANGYGWLWDEVRTLQALIARRRATTVAASTVSADLAPLRRGLKHATYPLQSRVANWIADVRLLRPVGSYLIRPEQLDAAAAQLAPGDVLLGRKNWYLSNVGLPGFWPHAMLYVGSDAQLAAAFDDDPEVLAWVERVGGRREPFTSYLARTYPHAWAERAAAGGGPLVIIEAVGEGVLQNSMEHACGDYLAGLRPELPAWVKARAVADAFGYLGRPYDFDFDFATDHALVCSELVWRCYRPRADGPGPPLGLRIDPVRVAGRMTLPPTELARRFAEEHGEPGAQLSFVLFYEGIEADQRARSRDEAAFLETPSRSKWDLAQR